MTKMNAVLRVFRAGVEDSRQQEWRARECCGVAFLVPGIASDGLSSALCAVVVAKKLEKSDMGRRSALRDAVRRWPRCRRCRPAETRREAVGENWR